MGLSDEDSAVRLQVLKVLENFTKENKGFLCIFSHQFVLDTWPQLFETSFLVGIKDTYHAIRATICSVLANIPSNVFDALPVNKQYFFYAEQTFRTIVAFILFTLSSDCVLMELLLFVLMQRILWEFSYHSFLL
jgi:hypothetical protein